MEIAAVGLIFLLVVWISFISYRYGYESAVRDLHNYMLRHMKIKEEQHEDKKA